jgi:hypothetical protein
VSREEDDGFLGRWSRLKPAQVRPAPAPGAVEEPSPDPAPPEPEPEALTEEELAALPRIEELTEGSDIRPFLRAGVPRSLRNAALRRMWMLTPAIRDHRDPAVDYAWDWNTRGGVPGDGVAPSPERAAEMLRDLLAPREKPDSERIAQDAADAEDATPALSADAGGTDPTPSTQETGAATRSETETEVARLEDAEAERDILPRRRHGSALPG